MSTKKSKTDSIIKREAKTVAAMIRIYCKNLHAGKEGLCPACSELLGYALSRLKTCPFKKNKPTCARCPVHCYNKVKREKIRAVMRYSGPRMLYKHPILAIFHLVHGSRSKKNRKHQPTV